MIYYIFKIFSRVVSSLISFLMVMSDRDELLSTIPIRVANELYSTWILRKLATKKSIKKIITYEENVLHSIFELSIWGLEEKHILWNGGSHSVIGEILLLMNSVGLVEFD